MSAGDNSTVSIMINVVDNNSAQVLSTTEARLTGIGVAAKQSGVLVDQFGRAFEQAGTSAAVAQGQLMGVGAAGTAAGAAVATGASQASAGMDRLAGSIQGARLAGEELGLRLPRAMYAVIGSNQALMAGLQSLFGLFVAIGAIGIFAQLGKEAYDLYERFLDVDAAMDQYMDNVKKSQTEDVINVRSIEDADARLHDVNTEMTTFRDLAKTMQSEGLSRLFGGDIQGGLMEIMSGKGAGDQSAKAAAQGDALTEKQLELRHQLADAAIATAHASDGDLKGQAKITAELQKQLALHAEEQRYTAQMDARMGNKTSSNSGKTLQDLQDTAARREAAARAVDLARGENDQIIQMQNQAVDAGLKGEALYQAQREQAIDAVVRKFNEGEISKRTEQAETAAINVKFDNEKMERLAAQERETEKIERDVQQAGLTGIAKLQAEGANRAADVDPENLLDPAQKQRRVVAAQQTTNAEIEQEQQEFYQRMAEMDDRSGSYMLEGYARIEAETRDHLDRIYDEYQKTFGQLDPLVLGDLMQIVQGTQVMQDAVSVVLQNAARERVELSRKTDEQITQMEAQAARATLPPWQAAQQDIIDQLNQRLAKEKQLLQQGTVTQQQYDQMIAADYALAQAQMEKAAEETRDKIASQLQSLFDNPEQFLRKKAEDLMFQILANWMMQLMNFNKSAGSVLGWLFGMSPQMSTSTNPMSALGSIFGQHSGSGGPMDESLGMPGSLGKMGAGSTLTMAGQTLSSSGTMLSSSATALSSAATALSTAATRMSLSTSGGGGGFGIPGMGGGDDSDDGSSSGETLGMPGGFSGTSSYGLGMGGSGTSSIDTLGPIGEGDVTSGVGDLAHTTADEASGAAGAANASGSSSLGMGLGIAGAAVGGGLALANAWKSGNTGAAVLSGGLTGASIGFMAGGPIGAAIGAGVGALVGFIGGLFSDHGLGKAKQYDANTLQPALAKELFGFDQGSIGYSQAMADLQNLQEQTWSTVSGYGTGARKYYNNTMVPEIQAAQAGLLQQMQGNRGAVSFSAAQYHDGGMIGDFGSLWTSPTTGFIHARLGETVMNPSASMTHGSTLAAMNTGLYRGGSSRMPASGGGNPVQITVQAIDSKSVSDWLRKGGARQIQSALNENVSQYGGFSLG